MQIDQQGDAPFGANPRQLCRQCRVIGLMDSGNPLLKLIRSQPSAPYLARSRQSARHQPQPAARTAVACVRGHHIGTLRRAATLDHVPINIILGPVEINQRTRRVSHQQGSACRPRDFHANPVDKAILQPQLRQFRIAHPRYHSGWIGTARVRHGNQHRQAQARRRGEREGGRIIQPRHAAPCHRHPHIGAGEDRITGREGGWRHSANLAAAFAQHCQSLIVLRPAACVSFRVNLSLAQRFLKPALLTHLT